MPIVKRFNSENELVEIVGKEIAQKIYAKEGIKTENGDNKELKGLNLKVGGSGMKPFYDKILPAQANKIGKKLGAKVGSIEIPANKVIYNNEKELDLADFSPKAQEYTSKYDESTEANGDYSAEDYVDDMAKEGYIVEMDFNSGEPISVVKSSEVETTSVKSIPITEAIKEQAKIGMPSYSKNNLEAINDKYNQDLQAQIEGKLPGHYIYQLGMPNNALILTGIPLLPIEMNSDKLKAKSSASYASNHPFDLANLKDLPNAIQNPIAIFNSKTKAGHKVVLIDLKQGEFNFIVAIQINSHPRGYQSKIEVNSIRSIYPKDNIKDIINWINRGDLLAWSDKKKSLIGLLNCSPVPQTWQYQLRT